MPLLDHFHPPLKNERPWEGFHSYWTGALVYQLNKSLLPKEYIAIPQVKISTSVEVDVATLEKENGIAFGSSEGNGGVATAVYAPPHPPLSFTVDFGDLDLFEIQVKEEDTQKLVAAIELVSPGNKDRPATRQAFVRKCATYLQERISIMVVDIVTSRSGNLHADLVTLLGPATDLELNDPTLLYAVAYRTLLTKGKARVEAWLEVLDLNKQLPILPLWLAEDVAVPVDLEQSYLATCGALRITLA